MVTANGSTDIDAIGRSNQERLRNRHKRELAALREHVLDTASQRLAEAVVGSVDAGDPEMARELGIERDRFAMALRRSVAAATRRRRSIEQRGENKLVGPAGQRSYVDASSFTHDVYETPQYSEAVDRIIFSDLLPDDGGDLEMSPGTRREWLMLAAAALDQVEADSWCANSARNMVRVQAINTEIGEMSRRLFAMLGELREMGEDVKIESGD